MPKKGTIHHIDTNKTEDVKINSNELQKTQDAIIRKIDGITSGSFDADPEKDKCEGCDWKALCQHKKFLVGANFKK